MSLAENNPFSPLEEWHLVKELQLQLPDGRVNQGEVVVEEDYLILVTFIFLCSAKPIELLVEARDISHIEEGVSSEKWFSFPKLDDGSLNIVIANLPGWLGDQDGTSDEEPPLQLA